MLLLYASLNSISIDDLGWSTPASAAETFPNAYSSSATSSLIGRDLRRKSMIDLRIEEGAPRNSALEAECCLCWSASAKRCCSNWAPYLAVVKNFSPRLPVVDVEWYFCCLLASRKTCLFNWQYKEWSNEWLLSDFIVIWKTVNNRIHSSIR